jgi:hypothetical protein
MNKQTRWQYLRSLAATMRLMQKSGFPMACSGDREQRKLAAASRRSKKGK